MITGGFYKRRAPLQEAEHGIVPYIAVDDVDEYIQKIVDLGGKTDKNHKMVVPDVCDILFFTDSEGNKLGLMHNYY